VRPRGLHIFWGWVPAGIFVTVAGVLRWGWIVTVFLVIGGVALAAYAEWNARRRRRRALEP
jgi:hypothetical protein